MQFFVNSLLFFFWYDKFVIRWVGLSDTALYLVSESPYTVRPTGLTMYGDPRLDIMRIRPQLT